MSESDELTFEVDRPFPVMTVIWGVAAVGIAAMSLVVEKPTDGWLFAAMMPASWAIASFLGRRRAIVGALTDTGIRLDQPLEEIPFDSIRGVTIQGRKPGKSDKKFKIRVYHGAGVLEIPKSKSVDSEEIYLGLLNSLPNSIGRPSSDLADYHKAQTDMFGEDRVFCFVALPGREKERPLSPGFRACCLATVLTSIVFIVSGTQYGQGSPLREGLIGFGVGVGIFAFLFYILSFVNNAIVGVKKWKQSCLVISPVGLALSQGDIQGELIWSQLKETKLRGAGSFRIAGSNEVGGGLQLKVEGATIIIADIYDRPISAIHQVVVNYHSPDYRVAEDDRAVHFDEFNDEIVDNNDLEIL